MQVKPQVFLLIVAVVLAGCIGQPGGGGGGGAGVIITGFAPDSATVGGFVGSDATTTPVTFVLEIKNAGEGKAENVAARLLGLSTDWGTVGSITLGTTTLFPADSQAGSEGESTAATIAVNSPTSKETDITYDVGVRVNYDYKTVAIGTFKVATPEYLRSITTPGGSPPSGFGITEFKSTGGPLVVTANMRVSTVQKEAKNIQIQFQIQNTGGGRAFKSAEDDNIVTIAESTCGSKAEFRLAGGKSATIFCTFPTDAVSTFIEKSFTLKLSYDYFVDSLTQVTVLKKPVT